MGSKYGVVYKKVVPILEWPQSEQVSRLMLICLKKVRSA